MEDDAALVAAALAGGPEAFGPVVERYQDAVFGIALARLRDFHEAEDTAQEVFVQAFECLGNLSDPKRLGAWLRSITIHRSIDRLRRRREAVDVDESGEPASHSPMPHEELARRELRDGVLAAIGRLSKTQRETTTLFYINGYSIEEVAAIQEVPAGTVKWRLHDARTKLKEEMMAMVEDVLKAEAPKEDFGEQVFGMLSRYDQPQVPWEEWDEVRAKLREIGTDGIEGFIKALESPHSRTRAFAAAMLQGSGQSDKVVEELLKQSLTDPNRKVRRIAAGAILGIIAKDETRRGELVPCLMPLLRDRCRRVRAYVAGYLSLSELGDCPKHIPLESVAGAVTQETEPGVRRKLIGLMAAVLDAQRRDN